MSTDTPRRRERLLALSWSLLAAVLVAALAVGAVHRAPAPNPAQRAAAIESALRCPSCEGISVAQSSAATAVAIRSAVGERVAEGQSDARIESFLVSRYGAGILLSPPARGGTVLVWVLPLAASAIALGALGVLFWRRRRVEAVSLDDEDRRLVSEALARRG